MSHRLLHTLVFSSSFLVEGCAMTHVTAPDAAAPSPDGATTPDAFVTPDASAPPDAFDPRLCEPGWPTTKGTFVVERNGLSYGCRYGTVDPENADLTLCCVLAPGMPCRRALRAAAGEGA